MLIPVFAIAQNTAKVPEKQLKGFATVYANRFIGLRTATGEIFKHSNLTAASNNFKINSCVLFQMPPRMIYREEKLEQIIENLNPAFTNVLEFRNETWWTAHVYNKLAQHNITFCGMSHPALPDDVVQNTKTVYFRFHGVPQLYKSKYEMELLKKIADEIENNSDTKEAFIYFNNDIDGSAITNAIEMEQYVSGYKTSKFFIYKF